MGIGKNYSKDELKRISQFIKMGLTNKEIAKRLNRPLSGVSLVVSRKLGGNPNYRLKKTKHKHLHEVALKTFLTHSFEETAKILKLTESELKSCLTYAYQNEKLSHIRKDKRRHDDWSSKDLLFLLKYSGILSRDEINKKINRGSSGRVIKEKLMQLKVAGKNVNGLTLSQFQKLFNHKPEFYIQTSAGSSGAPKGINTCFKIVPWAHIDELLTKGIIEHEETVKKYISTMAMFQTWIHGKDYWKSLTKY